MTRRLPSHVGCGLNVRVCGKLLEQRGFCCGVFQGDVDNEHRQQIGFACVEAAFEHMQLVNCHRIQTQCFGGQHSQSFFRVRGWNAIFVSF